MSDPNLRLADALAGAVPTDTLGGDWRWFRLDFYARRDGRSTFVDGLNLEVVSKDWRAPRERAELVERIITAEHQVDVLQRTLREYAEHVGDDCSEGSYAVALQARIVILEANIEMLTRRKDAA